MKPSYLISKRLGFRIVGERIEFLTFGTSPTGQEKITVRATQPVGSWAKDLWDECIVLQIALESK